MALPQVVLLPHSLLPLHIFETKYRLMLALALAGNRLFAIAQRLDPPDFDLDPPDMAPVIGVGLIRACVEREDGTSDLVLQGLQRVRVTKLAQADPFPRVGIADFPTTNSDPEHSRRLARQIQEQCRRLRNAGYRLPEQLSEHIGQMTDPEVICDVMAAAYLREPAMRQRAMETSDLKHRLELVLGTIKEIGE